MITTVLLATISMTAITTGPQKSEFLATINNERSSEAFKKKLLGIRSINRSEASIRRSGKREGAKRSYTSNSGAVKSSPTTNNASRVVAGNIPDISETLVTYVADVQVAVLDEKGKKIEGQTVLVSVVDQKQASASMLSPTLFASLSTTPLLMPEAKPFLVKGGKVDLKRVTMPSLVSIQLTDQGANPEWEIDGDVYSEALVVSPDLIVEKKSKGIIEKNSIGTLIPGSRRTTFGPKKVSKYPGEGAYKGRQVKLTRYVETRLLEAPFKTVVLKRQVADFEVPKPELLNKNSGASAKLFIGEQEEGATGLKVTDLGDRWAFKIRRDALEEKDDKSKQEQKGVDVKRDALVIQVETENGSFGAETSLENADFYEVNKLKQPELTLEAIANERIEFAGRVVRPGFELSPLLWLGNSLRPTQSITGDDALKLLEVKAKDRDQRDPTAGKNHKGRYGRWFTIPDKDLMIRCRYDSDENHPNPPIPQQKVNGILELVRVTGSRGGRIGKSLYVGASREEVETAFGKPDPIIPNLDKIKLLSSVETSLYKYGDRQIPSPSATYLYDGIRIGYDSGKVAWFEVARPIQLLYNGARAFIPDEARTIYLGDVTGSNASAVNGLRSALNSSVHIIGGMRVVNSASEADYVLSASVATSSSTKREQHRYSYTVKVKGKNETRYADENFLCEVAFAKVQVNLQLMDRANGTSRNIPIDELNDSGGWHSNHQRCEVSDPNYLLASLCSPSKIESKIRRPLNNAGTTASNILGTVLATNYDNGKMLVNLGSRQGVQDKRSAEVSEMALILVHEVDLKTGEPSDLRRGRLLAGNDMRDRSKPPVEWLEVQEVGADWCIVQLKRRGVGGQTVNAYAQIPRLLDPGSGLVRVQLVPKKGTGK